MLGYTMAMPGRCPPAPGRGSALGTRPAGAAGGGGAVAVALVGGSALPLRLEYVRDHTAFRIEELVAHLAPTAELVDLEQLGRCREVAFAGGPLDHGPVALAQEHLLGLLRVEEVHERLRSVEVVALVHDRGRVLDQDRLVRNHVVELLALLLRQDRLVLVAEQDVALAARERVERVTGAL